MKGHSLLYEGAQPFLYVKTLKGNTVVVKGSGKKLQAEAKWREKSTDLKGKIETVARGRARTGRDTVKRKGGDMVRSGGDAATRKVNKIKQQAGL